MAELVLVTDKIVIPRLMVGILRLIKLDRQPTI